MFIAHLPCGYLMTSFVLRRMNGAPEAKSRSILMLTALFAAILPDFDLLYFYFIDGRQTHHHHYWTHLPWFWLLVCSLLFAWAKVKGSRLFQSASLVFSLNIFLHLVLDSLAGGIAWLAPFSQQLIRVIEIQATRDWWVDNFIWHWSFGLELLLCYGAALLWARRRTRQCHQALAARQTTTAIPVERPGTKQNPVTLPASGRVLS